MLSIKERVEVDSPSIASIRPESFQEAVVTAPVIPDLAPAGAASFPDEVWVELPTEPETARKPRRSRTRGKKAEADIQSEATEVSIQPAEVSAADPVEAPASQPAIESAAAASEVESVPAPEVTQEEPTAEAPSIMEAELSSIATDPKTVFSATAAEATDPDPAEIQAPPEKPKRGWWRR